MIGLDYLALDACAIPQRNDGDPRTGVMGCKRAVVDVTGDGDPVALQRLHFGRGVGADQEDLRVGYLPPYQRHDVVDQVEGGVDVGRMAEAGHEQDAATMGWVRRPVDRLVRIRRDRQRCRGGLQCRYVPRFIMGRIQHDIGALPDRPFQLFHPGGLFDQVGLPHDLGFALQASEVQIVTVVDDLG